MSILNIGVSPAKILFAVDTMSASGAAGQALTYGPSQKSMILGSAVVGGRGNVGIFKLACLELLGMDEFLDVDLIVAMLPRVLGSARANAREILKRKGAGPNPHDDGRCEFNVAGWSEKRQRLRAVASELTADGRCMLDEVETYCASPGIPGAERLDLSTPVGMLAAAQAQTAHFKTIDPAAPIGGDLIVYEIMKGGIILREMGAI